MNPAIDITAKDDSNIYDDLEDYEAIQVIPDSDETKPSREYEESGSYLDSIQSPISSLRPSSSLVQERIAVIQIHHVDSEDDDEVFPKVIFVVPENGDESTSNHDHQEESMPCSNSMQAAQSPITSPRSSFSPVQAILRKPQEGNFEVSNPILDESQHNISKLLMQRRESAVSSMNRSNDNAAHQNRKAIQNLLIENKKGMY